MCWDQLPFELLQRIFYFCNIAYDHQPDKSDTFIDLQLVCKSWQKAAYEALYQDVYLAEGHVRFGDIVASQLGPLVNRVTFLFDFGNNKKAHAIVQSIMEHCPNVEEIHTSSDTERSLVWPLLLSPSSKLKKLKTLGEEGCNAFDTDVYTKVALKHKDTFTQLYLLNNNANPNIPMNVVHQPLVRHLSKFTALQHLIVNSTFEFSHDSLDQLLNDCPPTLHKLIFEVMRLTYDAPLPTNIKPMTHAKQLSISRCVIHATSLLYLTRKMKRLQELKLDYLYSQAADSWWDLLSELCLPVQVYDIAIQLEREQVLFQLDKCFNLIRKSVPMQDNSMNSKRELHIESLDEYDYFGLIGYNVQLKRAKDEQAIVINPYSFRDVSIMDILQLAKQYLPNSIRFEFENVEDIYQHFLAEDVNDQSTKQFLPAQEIKEIMVKHHNVDINNSWGIIKKAFQLLEQAQQASLYFRNMILLDTELSSFIPTFKHLSLLSFEISILQHGALSKLSSVVHHIDRLEISSCTILMDEPHNLKLFLPFTTIHTLSWTIRPLLENNAYQDGLYENCLLENLESIKAVFLEGQYTLKIDTREKTYVRRGKGSQILEEQDQGVGMTTGTKDNFFIWIKCLDLDEFRISNDWNQNDFEKLRWIKHIYYDRV